MCFVTSGLVITNRVSKESFYRKNNFGLNHAVTEVAFSMHHYMLVLIIY